MKNIKTFEQHIEVTDLLSNSKESQLEVTIDGEDFTFGISDNDVYFLTDDDENLASERGIVLDDKLRATLFSEYKSIKSKTKMKRFGFFK